MSKASDVRVERVFLDPHAKHLLVTLTDRARRPLDTYYVPPGASKVGVGGTLPSLTLCRRRRWLTVHPP